MVDCKLEGVTDLTVLLIDSRDNIWHSEEISKFNRILFWDNSLCILSWTAIWIKANFYTRTIFHEYHRRRRRIWLTTRVFNSTTCKTKTRTTFIVILCTYCEICSFENHYLTYYFRCQLKTGWNVDSFNKWIDKRLLEYPTFRYVLHVHCVTARVLIDRVIAISLTDIIGRRVIVISFSVVIGWVIIGRVIVRGFSRPLAPR